MAKKKNPLLNQAKLLAKTLIDPQIAEYNREAAAREERAQHQASTAAAVASVVHALSGGDAERIRSAYETAGQNVSGFAKGLTGAVGTEAQKSAAETATKLAQFGAPQIGPDATVTPALDTLSYTKGLLPAGNLASEAANRMAWSTLTGQNQEYATSQQALQQMRATNAEAEALRQKGYDLERTRPGEIQKALLVLRDEQRKDRNLSMQERSANAQIYSLLQGRADQLTDQTGTLWVVKNGRPVNTGRPAPGSTAVTHAQDVTVRQQTANQRAAHDLVMEGIAQGQLDVSQQRANAYVKKQQQYAAGGFSQATIRQWKDRAGKVTTGSFKGIPNPNYVKGVDPSDPKYAQKKNPWIAPPRTAESVLRQLLAEGLPYQIVYSAIRTWAKASGSRWAGALKWQKVWPPKKKK